MNNQMKESNVEVDLKRLLDAAARKAWIIMLVSVLCAVLTFVGTLLLITPKYESSAMFYVNNSSLSVGDASFSISSSDISASKNLVESYIVILKTRSTLNDVIDYAGVGRSFAEVRDMISANSVNDTEIFEVVVTSPDPQEAELIANAIAYILPKRISSIIEGTSAKIVDSAVIASRPSSPSYTMNTLLGFLLGFVLALGGVVLQELFDITIRTEEDIAQVTQHPVLASVPDMNAPGKGAYYGYGKKSERNEHASGQSGSKGLIGSEIGFAAAESYKLLRTKLQYSFAGEDHCRIVGVSSALTGEGKSLTAVNLAYSLSQLGKRILLVDCDMRRPSLATKLNIAKKPGLSGYLSGQVGADRIIQMCGLKGEENVFHVIAAGQNPPNPVELLSSGKMTKLLRMLQENYDCIILDLPPIDEVSDALAVARKTDGVLLVVRQNYCTRPALHQAVRQFAFVDTRILGIVYNCTQEETGGYGKKYYKKYYKGYYRRDHKPEKKADT